VTSNSQISQSVLINLIPIRSLSPDHCQELAEKSTIHEIEKGKYLFKTGESDEHVLYLLKGSVELIHDDGKSRQVQGGTKSASLPLEQNKIHMYSARAISDASYLRVDANLLDIMLTWEQSGGYEVQELESDGTLGADDDDWMSRILTAQVFRRIPPANIQSIFMRMQPEQFAVGETVIRQGDDGDRFYIIRDGGCKVIRQTRKNPEGVVLANLAVGDNFGEEALISGGKRNASIVMTTQGSMMSLTKTDFLELMNEPLLNWVDYNQAKSIETESGVWIDVRLPSEFQTKHLRNSVNIPLPILRSKVTKLNKDRQYIVCCETGRRSSTAAYLLGQNGLSAFVLQNGLQNLPTDEFLFGAHD